jgi:vacuolar-type H+-ATPase subunit H
MLIGKRAQTRNLWGKEFSVVGDGLAEAEVVAFVSELLQRQQHQSSLMELAQRTVIEAEKLALSLREKAKSEAEAEAAGIISQVQAQAEEEARAIAQHTLAEADELALSLREKAKGEAEAEAAGIVSQAHAHAEGIAQQAQETRQSILAQAEEEARAITQHTLAETDELALSLREKAKGEAEAEAAGILSQAHAHAEGIAQEAQETRQSILAQAEEEARAITQHTLAEADELALSLREEAETEAATTISQAQARAEEIDQEAQQAALSLKENAREEAEAESTTLISQAQAKAEEIAEEARQAALSQFREKVSARTQRLHDRLLEMVQEELGKEDGKMVGPALTAPAPYFPQTEPGDPLTQKIEEALANWQAMPISSDAPPSPEGNPVPELFTEVPQANGENLVSGEVDLIVAPPIDLAQLTSFQRRLRKQSEVRLIQTVGSWNQGLAISVFIKQPLPLMETLQGMPEVESVQGSNGAKKEAGKELRQQLNITLRRRPRQKTEGSGL